MAQTAVTNMQASLALTQYFPLGGVFPSQGGGGTDFYFGEIGTFAGNFVPSGASASGQFLAINQNTALFSLLGTNFGGDGVSTFELPNLNGTTMVGTGQGSGLGAETIGEKGGSAAVTLSYGQTPAFNLNPWGQIQAFDNHQPSLGITYEIATQGVFPSQGGGSNPLNTLGMVMAFAGTFEAGGYVKCDGRLMSISQNTALFAILGTTYGGNGITTFGLPDLRGRDIIGASATNPIGAEVGTESITLTNSQVPNNVATTPVDNMQPSLAMNYLIALQGIFPTQGGNQDPTTPFLGQVVNFAGTFAPSGWAKCDGSLMSIAQNQALFSVLGTTYGGNGVTTFALPDLRDKAVIGTGAGYVLGTTYGANSVTVTVNDLPFPQPKYGGSAVTIGQFGSWKPLDSVASGGGYQIVWKNGGADQYIVWNTDGSGNFLSQGSILSGGTYAIQSLETTVNQDLNGDGTLGLVTTTIEAFAGTDLKQVADTFFLYNHGTTTGPQLKMSGAAVKVGQFGAGWTPLGAEKLPDGTYVAVWKNGAADQDIVWNIDSAGNWVSQSDPVPGTNSLVQALEPGFNQDLNGGGIAIRTPIESLGATSLARIANTFVISPAGSTLGWQIKMSGSPVTVGQYGNYTPLGAEKSPDGTYQVVWKNGGLDQYVVWTVDGTGNILSQTAAMSGITSTLQSLETTFGQDLNSDGTLGLTTTTIEALGGTDLKQVADTFYLYAHGTNIGPQLKMSGAAVKVGQFGAGWTPLGAEKLPDGTYVAVWKNGAADQDIVWNIDSAGNWVSQSDPVPGTNSLVQALEPGFNQDLNGGGIAIRTPIESLGATSLAKIANTFVISPAGSTLGWQIKMSGAPVTVGQYGNYTPLGAEKSPDGTYLVVWKNGGLDEYVVWALDGTGNWLSQSAVMPGASSALQVLEPAFNQDLDGVGGIAARTVIESAGSTTLAKIANTFVISPTGSVLGMQIKAAGAAVTVGQFGNWTPLGAEKMADGSYQMAWKNGGLDQYLSWIVDSAGNFVSQSPVEPGSSWYTQNFETILHQDLNNDTVLGPVTTTIENYGMTKLSKVADSYFLDYGTGPQISINGAFVTVGQFGNYTPIGAEKTAGGYQVAWKNGAADEYVVWSTDIGGNFQSQTAVMSGAAIAAYETSFQQDLNSNGMIDPPSVLASDSLSGGSQETSLLANYMASSFATPAGEGAGVVEDPQSSQQPFLAKPLG